MFTGTSVAVSSLFANLAEAIAVQDFIEWFQGPEEWQARAVLEHEVKSLDARVAHAVIDQIEPRKLR